ncbi:hypothetical protein BBJ28_00012359 [Nothophytophthora sp. Chile5]|nr:hypothetical protein BBJ28_00012359 [Nothophytophthora sp. Chile5]
MARYTQLAFLLENATAVHLTLVKSLLVDEQLTAQPQDVSESWRLRSHDHVQPKLQFNKIRTVKAYKRERCPFEICCVSCQAKIGSEGYLEELEETVFMLDSKSCTCVVDQQKSYGMSYGMTGELKVRKWGKILKLLQEMQLPLQIQKLQDLMANVGGDNVGVQQAPAAPVAPIVPVIFPTEASIRNHFSPRGRMSRLRRYQVELALSALLENTIVYLPTGKETKRTSIDLKE